MTPAFFLVLALGAQADVPLFSRPSPALEAGAEALERQAYDAAIGHYRDADAKTAKERAIVEYNVGIASLEKAQHLKMMEAVRQAQEAAGGQGEDATLDEAVAETPDFDRAVDALERAYKLSENPRLRSQAALGVGNSYALQENYKKAVDGYRRALVQDPANMAARNNLRTTLRRMRMKKPPPNQGEGGEQDDSGEGDSEDGDEGEEGKQGGDSEQGDGEEQKQEDGEGQDGDEQGDQQEGQQDGSGDADENAGDDASGQSGDQDNADDASSNGDKGEEKKPDGADKKESNTDGQKDGESGQEEGEKKEESSGNAGGENDEQETEDKPGSSKEKGGEENAENEKDPAAKEDGAGKDAADQKPKDATAGDEEKPKPGEDPKKQGAQQPPKGQPGQGESGRSGQQTKPETAEKQRARAILDALRRRERPLGPVMMNPPTSPRRKVKKDW